MMDEPAYTSVRTDPEAYAEQALAELCAAMPMSSPRRRGHVRDALAEAFEWGEHQGVCRAIRILAIAKEHAQTEETKATLAACLQILIGEPLD